jgi:hypothetical protein
VAATDVEFMALEAGIESAELDIEAPLGRAELVEVGGGLLPEAIAGRIFHVAVAHLDIQAPVLGKMIIACLTPSATQDKGEAADDDAGPGKDITNEMVLEKVKEIRKNIRLQQAQAVVQGLEAELVLSQLYSSSALVAIAETQTEDTEEGETVLDVLKGIRSALTDLVKVARDALGQTTAGG